MGDIVELRPPVTNKWLVKVRRYAEAFWVEVADEELGTLTGTVANNVHRLPFGTPICFERAEVLEEIRP